MKPIWEQWGDGALWQIRSRMYTYFDIPDTADREFDIPVFAGHEGDIEDAIGAFEHDEANS